jgi:hypothetical protein
VNSSRGAMTTTRGAQITTISIRASGTTRVHPKSASQMTSSRLWIVLREARRQRRRSNSKSSCKRNAHGIQVPIIRQSIATTSGGHSAIPAMTRRTSRRIKSPKRTTKGTNRATQSFKMPQKPSTSSSEVTKSSVPGGNTNYYSEKSCPSSRQYHDHSDGRRSPSRSHETINGPTSRSSANSASSWTRWSQRSSSPKYSSTAEAVSTSTSPAR